MDVFPHDSKIALDYARKSPTGQSADHPSMPVAARAQRGFSK
jgi:hypothetical protein